MKLLLNYLIFILIFTSCGKAPLFNSIDKSKNPYQSPSALMASSDQSFQLADSNYAFGLEWVEGPNSFVKSSFRLRFWDRNTGSIWGPYEKIEPKLCVMLWMQMPDGGEHGSAPVTISTQRFETSDFSPVQTDWIYLVDDAYFVMNGLWQIRIRLIANDQSCGALKSDPFLKEEVLEVHID